MNADELTAAWGYIRYMTDLLKRALKKAEEELSEPEQDEFARWLMETIESDERRWDEAFARSPKKLEKLATRALKAARAGRAEPLDPGKL